MIRTQIQLTAEQDRRLRRFAAREGVSLAEAVRRCIDQVLSEDDLATRYASAASLVGVAEDSRGATDVSERHDAYLEDAFTP